MMLQIQRYGSLMGFVYYSQEDDSLADKAMDYGRIFVYARFLIISIVCIFIVEYIYRFHKKMNKIGQKPFVRNFININLKDV